MCSLYPLYIRDEPSSWAHKTPVLESPEHETANLDAINQSIRVSDKLNSLSVNGQATPAAHATRPPEPVPLLCPLLFINIRAPCCSRHAPISSGHSRESRSARSTRKLPRSVCNFPISRLCPRGAPQSKPPNSTGSIGGALPVGSSIGCDDFWNCFTSPSRIEPSGTGEAILALDLPSVCVNT